MPFLFFAHLKLPSFLTQQYTSVIFLISHRISYTLNLCRLNYLMCLPLLILCLLSFRLMNAVSYGFIVNASLLFSLIGLFGMGLNGKKGTSFELAMTRSLICNSNFL